MTTAVEKKKKPTITTAKKKMQVVFSTYIRMRDCLNTTCTLDYGRCCTCGKIYPRKKLQAGHFIPGRQDSILYEPTCVHAQCYRCNVQRSGEWVKYFRFMEQKYGREEIFRLMELSEETHLITFEWIDSTIIYYQQEIAKLEKIV